MNVLATVMAAIGAGFLVAPGCAALACKRDVAVGSAAAVAAGAVTWLIFGIPAIAGVAALSGVAGPALARRRVARLAAQRRATVWPDAIDMIRAVLGAGATLPEAIADSADRAPQELAVQFRAAAGRLRMGDPFAKAVRHLDRGQDPVARRVIPVLVLADEIGSSDTGRVLESLSAFVRADLAQQREVAARHSWNVSAARVAVLAPWLTVAALSVQPSARTAYSSSVGTALLAVVAVVTVVAYAVMSRAGRVSGLVGESR